MATFVFAFMTVKNKKTFVQEIIGTVAEIINPKTGKIERVPISKINKEQLQRLFEN